MSLLKGKRALVLGLANERFNCLGIAQEMKKEGAALALAYLNPKLKTRVVPLAEKVAADFCFEFDATVDEHYSALKELVLERWEAFDILVHSLAFAQTEDLKRSFIETDRRGFQVACEVSAFSLVALCNTLYPLMNANGSVLAMTYHGSQQVVPGYNIMGVAKAALEASMRYLALDLGKQGIRINCISAGPIRTLSSSVIPGMKKMFRTVEERSFLKRNITPNEVGKTAVYLSSDLSSGVSGQIIYTDAGMSSLACT